MSLLLDMYLILLVYVQFLMEFLLISHYEIENKLKKFLAPKIKYFI